MKRLGCLVLLLSLLCFSASAEVRYPIKTAEIHDFADVLSQEAVEALKGFNSALDKTKVKLYVATVHFLDGEDVRTYTQTVFRRWGLGENDLLLLMAVGEDAYYSVAGKRLEGLIPEETRRHMLSTSFETAFMGLDYDGAMAGFIPAFAAAVGKNLNVTVPLPSFYQVPVATTRPAAIPEIPAPPAIPEPPVPIKDLETMIEDFAESMERLGDNFSARREERERALPADTSQATGITPGSIFLLLLIVFLIISPRKNVRDWGTAAGCTSCCGCAPLGWLFGLLGLHEVLNPKRKWKRKWKKMRKHF